MLHKGLPSSLLDISEQDLNFQHAHCAFAVIHTPPERHRGCLCWDKYSVGRGGRWNLSEPKTHFLWWREFGWYVCGKTKILRPCQKNTECNSALIFVLKALVTFHIQRRKAASVLQNSEWMIAFIRQSVASTNPKLFLEKKLACLACILVILPHWRMPGVELAPISLLSPPKSTTVFFHVANTCIWEENIPSGHTVSFLLFNTLLLRHGSIL